MTVAPIAAPQQFASLSLAAPANDVSAAAAPSIMPGNLADFTPKSAQEAATAARAYFSDTLSSPGALGERIADRLDRFYDSTQKVKEASDSAVGSNLPAVRDAGLGPNVLASEAPMAVQETPPDPSAQRMEQLQDMMMEMYDFAIEAQLVMKSGTQFASTVNMLMRGQ